MMDANTTIIKMTLVEIRLRPSSRSQMDGPFTTRMMYKARHASKIQITYIFQSFPYENTIFLLSPYTSHS